MVRRFGEPLAEAEVWDFLRRRRPILGAAVISGGEPTLQPDLAEFCRRLQGLGYAVKLDTNGSAPEVISGLIDRRLINYLALDLKADPRRYPREIAPDDPGEAILATIAVLKRSGLPHEFRITAAAPFVSRESMPAMARAVTGLAPVFLQRCRLETTLDPEFMSRHPPPDPDALQALADLARPHLPVHIRA